MTIIHLRSEKKALEHRSALTPTTAEVLKNHGYDVRIERSPMRIFDDKEFEIKGLKMVPEGSWVDAPAEAIILGLKEHPDEETFPLKHTHIQFAHCYKGQGGWQKVLNRWVEGKGLLLDLEFLQDERGRRVAAFGYHAGFAGAALGIEALAKIFLNEEMGNVHPFDNEAKLIEHVKRCVQRVVSKGAKPPTVMVMGALGRCGRGAIDCCEKVGVGHIFKWDMAETAKGGPFEEILQSHVFVNCIYLNQKIPPFIDPTTLNSTSRKLCVVVDVSCDTTNPNNPIPIYSINTTFSKPTVPVETSVGPPLEVISIDHLPSLLPREASEAFSQALLPSLLQLDQWKSVRVWSDAEKLFHQKVEELETST